MVPVGLGPMPVSTVHVLGSIGWIWWPSSPGMRDVLTHFGAPPLSKTCYVVDRAN